MEQIVQRGRFVMITFEEIERETKRIQRIRTLAKREDTKQYLKLALYNSWEEKRV
jgi:hypothetical protein